MTRALAWMLAGLGGSLILRGLNPLAGAGPLVGTLAVLPLVIGLFAASGQFSKRAHPASSGFESARLAAAAMLLVLALARVQLGFRYGEVLGDSVIFSGLIGLLAWQAFESLRNLDGANRRSRQIAFFLIVLAVYAGIAPWTSAQRPPDGDEPYYLLLAHSLAYDLDADLRNNYAQDDSLEFMPRRIEPQPGDPVGPAGEQFSRHNVLLPLILAGFYRIAGLPGVLAIMALIAAALATTVLRIAELYFPERSSANLLAASITALCPPLLLQSNQVWVEVPAALLVAVAIESAARLEISPASRTQLARIFAAALLLPLLKLRFLALSVPILAIAIARAPKPRRAALLRALAFLLAVATAILLFNQASFGRALKHHSWQSLLSYVTAPSDYLSAPLGLLLDSSFGLLIAAPIWALALPGAWVTFRRRRSLFVAALVVSTPYLLLLGPRPEWYGGWSPFFRYGMVFLPFLALFLVPMLAERASSGVAILIATLGSATACLTLLWLVLPGWTYNFADGRGYLLDHLTVTLGMDMARLFPSEVRPRAANLAGLLLVLGISALAIRWRRATLRLPFAAGVAVLLTAPAILVSLGAALPTRVIEFEDPYVSKQGGRLWPDRWAPSRISYRGSWSLGPGDRLSVPIRPDGRNLELAIDLQRHGPIDDDLSLELLVGEERVILLPLPRSSEWSTVRLDLIPWSADAGSLEFRLLGTQGQVLLDRARLEWR